MRVILTISLGLIFFTAKAQQDNLVLHYAFEDEVGFYAVERVSNEKVGKAILGAYFLEDGLYLDGTDDELESEKSETTRLNGAEISISAWIKADAVGGDRNTILSKGFAYELTIDAGKIFFEIVVEGFDRMSFVTKEPVIIPGKQQHILVARKGTEFSLFVDGVEITEIEVTDAVETNLYPANNDIYIGSGKAKDYFDGIIYDVKIFDKAFGEEIAQQMISDGDMPEGSPSISIGSNIFLQNFSGEVELTASSNIQNGEISSSEWRKKTGPEVTLEGNKASISELGKYVFEYEVVSVSGKKEVKQLFIWNFPEDRPLVVVNPATGNDESGEGTLESPYQTISKAVAAASELVDAVIILSEGEYVLRERLIIPPRTSFVGAGSDYTILKAGTEIWNKAIGTAAINNSMLLFDKAEGAIYVGQFKVDGANKEANVGVVVANSNNLEMENVHIVNTYYSGLVVHDVRNSLFHDLYLQNTSWGNTDFSSGCIGMGNVFDVDLYNVNISEGILDEPAVWGYGIKVYQVKGSKEAERVRIYDSKIETETEALWNNGQAPNIAIEFHSTSFIDCEIFNVETNQTISMAPNRFIDNTRNARIHHNKVIGSGGVALESYMQNCEIDHNYFIGEYFTIKGFNNNIYEDYLVHHNVFSDIFPKQGASQGMSYGGLKNVKFYNNTIYNTIFNHMPIIELFGGVESDNIDIANNICYTTQNAGGKVVALENGSTVTRLKVRNNATYNYEIGTPRGTQSANRSTDPNLELIPSDSYWIPVARSDSWVVDAGRDVGLPFKGAAPDIGAGEDKIGLLPNGRPTIDELTPYSNTSATLSESITISASAFDSDGEIAEMMVYVNDTLFESSEEGNISYEYTPQAPGAYSIKVTAIDNDGLYDVRRSEFFIADPLVLSILDESNQNDDLLIYPNPSESGVINISSSVLKDGQKYQVRAYDMSGTLISETWLPTSNGQLVYEMGMSIGGLYLIHVETEKGGISKKVIVK